MPHASQNTAITMTLFVDTVALALFWQRLVTKNLLFGLFLCLWCTLMNPCYVNSYEEMSFCMFFNLAKRSFEIDTWLCLLSDWLKGAPILQKTFSYANQLLKYFSPIQLKYPQSKQTCAFSFARIVCRDIVNHFWYCNFNWTTRTFFNRNAYVTAFEFICLIFCDW